jgi:sigma-E factor negative regulatory protein RseB
LGVTVVLSSKKYLSLNPKVLLLKSLLGMVGGFFLPMSLWATDIPLASVNELLEKASKALQEKNYKGRFSYEFAGTRETLEIIHAVKKGVEHERLVHLNGPERELIRQGRQPNCVSAGSFLLRGGLIPQSNGAVSLAEHYHFFLKGRDRVAGRDAEFIQIVPRDNFRYGMLIAVDRASHLPLMSMITTGEKTALERFQFSDLEVDLDITDDSLVPVTQVANQMDGRTAPCSFSTQLNSTMQWQANWLPPGFVLSQAEAKENGLETFTYTDGLASFTLFVREQSSGSPKQGAVRRGASLAMMMPIVLQDRHLEVALIGEIPMDAARQIVSSIALKVPNLARD